MANIWFISDTHFSHENIIKYCNRPFKHANEMDEFLVAQWNTYVKPSDHVYHLGDVSMCRPRLIQYTILARLNGHLRLVRGNHDIAKTKEYIECGFDEVYGSRVLDNLIFTHIPIHPASMGRFQANVHGHIHNNQGGMYKPVEVIDKVTEKPRMAPYVNISVEVIDYHPISLEDIKQRVREAA